MSTMTASYNTFARTRTVTPTLPKGGDVRLAVTVAVMSLFLAVAFAGAFAQVTSVVIAAGFMSAAVALFYFYRTISVAIASPEV
ncbi:MAG: hypothetical protein ACTHW1_02480 [Ancrocorticia sp.]|uniref:hypothetical protein n=1 Tax=Ancrocorticia sp. TaxID=2593684 RepID=UPI003F8EB553